MKLSFVVIVITIFLIVNLYYDNKYLKFLKQFKKYYQMIFIAFLGLCLYLLVKKKPNELPSIMKHADSMIKHLPLDKESGDILKPLFKLTKTYNKGSYVQERQENIIRQSGRTNGTKRSVSETKKKYVAAQQGWKCAMCNQQLNAWFEVDHTTRLENGGSNHISNLTALCRECHGKKTAMEKF